jgi:hypothetical protein
MTGLLQGVSCACLPASGLVALADLRCLPGVRVLRQSKSIWLRWEPTDDEILRRVLAIGGARLYQKRDGRWYEPGRHLPAFDVPELIDGSPLSAVLTPAPVEAKPAPTEPLRPVSLSLVRDSRFRPAGALLSEPAPLVSWCDRATTKQITALRAARKGNRILLTGRKLPALVGAQRFWGRRVFVPLGYRAEPALAESDWLSALGMEEEAVLLLTNEGAEVVPGTALQPLSRAAARLAVGDPIP